MIDRRAFIAGGAAVLAAPFTADGQQADKSARIGYLALNLAAGDPRPRTAFVQGLRDLGYVEGRNVLIEYRDAEGRTERFRGLAAELRRSRSMSS